MKTFREWLSEKEINEDNKKSKLIDDLFRKNDKKFKEIVLNYFKKEYPNKKFSLDKIEDIYYDMTDSAHIDNIYDLITKK